MSQSFASNPRLSSTHVAKADSLSKSILLFGCLMAAQRGIGFARSFYVCGALTPSEVGQWDLAFSFLMLAAPLAVLGIPGSFGRYVALFESRGMLPRLFTQTFIACAVLALLAMGCVWIFSRQVASLFFGDAAYSDLVGILALGLPIVVFFNFATCWFTGRRLNRFVFRIQFTQSVFFAVLCVCLLKIFATDAKSIIYAYFASCIVGLLLSTSYLFLTRNAFDADRPPETDRHCPSIWMKLLPFAVWVWMSNALINLFSVCDRLLLVNFYPSNDIDVQSLVGQYHASRILPLLLLAVGGMAGSMIVPYLSKDWEAKKQDAVNRTLNLAVKFIGLASLATATGVLILAPVLFGGIWSDKFAMGEALLPLTLSYCSLAAMTLVAQKYFWCIEKTWYSSCVLAVGIAANCVLGLFLIQLFEIKGVVLSTLVAHAIVLFGVLHLCRLNGMRVDRGIVILAVSLLAIAFGKWIACAAFTVVLVVALTSSVIFSEIEKQAAIAKCRSLRTHLLGDV